MNVYIFSIMRNEEDLLPDKINAVRADILLLHFRYLSRNIILKRMSSPNFRYGNAKLISKITQALTRHEQGLQAIKSGVAKKVV